MVGLSVDSVEGPSLHSHVPECTLELWGDRPLHPIWDIGAQEENPDGSENYSSDQTFEQLLNVLDALEGTGFTLILCHSGAGPDREFYSDYLSAEFQAYRDRVQTLLDDYPNVYFELAGMQVDSVDGTRDGVHRLFEEEEGTSVLTPLGNFLLGRILRYPHRFMLGTDTDNREDDDTADSFGIDSYLDSVDNYDTFLGLTYVNEEHMAISGTPGDRDRQGLRHLNARGVFRV